MAETSTQGSGRNSGTPGLHLRQRFCPPCLTLVILSQCAINVPVYHGSNLKVVDKRVRLAELVLRCVICGRKSSP
nr:CASP-like protein 2B1 [Ipomoea trifida]